MLDPEKIESRLNTLKEENTIRDSNFSKLDRYYRGTLLKEELENETYRYVINHLSQTIDDYAVLESSIPEFQVPPPVETDEGRTFADNLEKLIYGLWGNNYPGSFMQGMSIFKNLFGGAPVNIHPDPKNERKLKFTLGQPGNFYYMESSDDENVFEEVFFIKRMRRGTAARYDKTLAGSEFERLDIIFYWNKDEYAVVYNKKILGNSYINHKWGFVPWVMIKQIPYPNEVLGESTLKWLVALNKYINQLMSDYSEIVHYNAAPIIIGEGTGKTPETWLTGPNAFNEIRKGGKVSLLQLGGLPSIDTQLARVEGQYDERAGLAGGILHGKTESTLTSGKVITGLTAGTEIRIASRQILMSEGIQLINKYALKIVEKENLGNTIRGQRRGETFALQYKPEDIKGYYENLCRWPIGLWDYPSKVVTILQLIGAKIMSKYTGMETLLTRSPIDEMKRIEDEQMREMKMMAAMRALEERAPQEITPPGGQKTLEAPKTPEGSEAVTAEELRSQKGATEKKKPQGRPKVEKAPTPGGERITLNEVSRRLANIEKLKGDVYLGGGLVTEGYTDRDIDLWLSNMKDKQTILNAIPEYKGRFTFMELKGEKPKGSHLRVMSKPETR